ncbi:hypothetical protein HYFRA_00004319 [Hymenoscyphus fraxineus]|uniref:Amidase domain-containing protein n=1 Tax=Hymenoscyphus fraxineus TaxID=746836 RepID=A0A9N9PQ11_9HELO|nr:hypothetical protein HYFRA_00004319 [Hymenoscyphus fraxineus]
MSDPKPLYLLTAHTEILTLLKQNTITVESYAQSLLHHINDRDPIINAWTYLNPEIVLKQARELDKIPSSKRGPLHGIAVGVKDVIHTKDMPTQFGSPLYEGNQSSLDSSIVSILRSAGALILGKTTTSPFTLPNHGPLTTNPQDPTRTPGESSTGSVAAPSYNAISPEGQKICSLSVDTSKFFARSIEDLQLLADVFTLKDDGPLREISLREAKVAIMKTPAWSQAGPGTITATKTATEILKKHSVTIEDLSFPPNFNNWAALKRIHTIITESDAQEAFKRTPPRHNNHKTPSSNPQSHQYALLRPIFDDLAADYSVIFTPSAIDEAPLGLEDFGSAAFNWFWTGR